MEGGRKWEDLNMDCLANAFGKVGLESLLLDVPFVCKSWYKTTLNPKCWERLIFPEMETNPRNYDTFTSRLMEEYQVDGYFSITTFIKSVVKRSRQSATLVSLPSCVTKEALNYVGDECPVLEALLMPYHLPSDIGEQIPSHVHKWKHLELLRIGSSFKLKEILAEISINCNNFGALVTTDYIDKDEASAIVTFVPNIQYLVLTDTFLEREDLVTILEGCKELVHLDVRDCIGFQGDDEIIKLASNIGKFMFEGSRPKNKLSEELKNVSLVDLSHYCDDDWYDNLDEDRMV